MQTKALTLIIVFTALTVALSIYGPKIPFPLSPFLYYQLWEIPIVVAFLMIGPKTGIAISAINTLVLFAVFPGALPTGPLYNFIAVLSMFLGIYLPYRLATRGCKGENLGDYLRRHVALLTVSATILGIILRVAVMTVVTLFTLQQPYPIGFSMPEIDVLVFLPVGAVFNATVVLYTIPIAIAITIAILSRLKIK
jgi:riboflavin transporter FmnP